MFIYKPSKNNYLFQVTEKKSLRHTVTLAPSKKGMTVINIGVFSQRNSNNPLK